GDRLGEVNALAAHEKADVKAWTGAGKRTDVKPFETPQGADSLAWTAAGKWAEVQWSAEDERCLLAATQELDGDFGGELSGLGEGLGEGFDGDLEGCLGQDLGDFGFGEADFLDLPWADVVVPGVAVANGAAATSVTELPGTAASHDVTMAQEAVTGVTVLNVTGTQVSASHDVIVAQGAVTAAAAVNVTLAGVAVVQGPDTDVTAVNVAVAGAEEAQGAANGAVAVTVLFALPSLPSSPSDVFQHACPTLTSTLSAPSLLSLPFPLLSSHAVAIVAPPSDVFQHACRFQLPFQPPSTPFSSVASPRDPFPFRCTGLSLQSTFLEVSWPPPLRDACIDASFLPRSCKDASLPPPSDLQFAQFASHSRMTKYVGRSAVYYCGSRREATPDVCMASPFPSLSAFAAHLSHEVDIMFPVIHGKFGEDGGIQALLEQHSIPFVGTSAAAAADFLALNSQPSHPLSLPGTVGAA
ncbi:unnamed protein product, partial [Closterium sp. Naga37s-1]